VIVTRSTLYRHGRVRSPEDPFATALLVVGDTIAWVGQESAAAHLHADETVDLQDAWVAPAFVDAHVHATATGLALTGLDLTGTTSLAQALRLVEDHARRERGGAVLGTGWDETRWPEGRPPTSAELDRASYGGVVYLARTDVHSAVASSALLAACPEARSLPGFLPDGLVRQQAHHAVRRTARGTLSAAQVRTLQGVALDRAAELGIACLHECGGPDISGEQDFVGLLALEHGVERIGYWGELGAIEKARELGAVAPGGDLFLDGSIGSSTASVCEHFEGSASTGELYCEPADVVRHLELCATAGVQTGFHAIGDNALEVLLSSLDAVADLVGEQALRAGRHRVEHAEMLSPDHIRAMARFGLTASVQPAFDARWGGSDGMYTQRLGRERALAMNPFAALAAAGVPLALGSDSPVTHLDPWGTIRAAVHHRTPGSGLSARAAFSAHTRGGWRAARRDAEGALVPGAPATFAVWEVDGELVVQTPDERVSGWSTDPRAAVSGLPDLDGPTPRCLRTVVRGAAVHVLG
jgi:predicted amidohydrolase YtcJ